jgi:hypothetical protein
MSAAGEPVNWNRTIINLAYEGVPQRAITRATPTDRKIVSVMICSIRKRLRGRYTIQTVQGSGYFMPDDDRRRAAKYLLGCIGGAADDAAVKKLTGSLELLATG